MRTLLIGGALGAFVIALSGCGGSSVTSADHPGKTQPMAMTAIPTQSTRRLDIDVSYPPIAFHPPALNRVIVID